MTTCNRRCALRHAAHEGQVLVIFAFFALVLVGFVALSIDAGFLMAERRQVQSAADAAALAAASAAQDRLPMGQVTMHAREYGQINAGPDASVTVNRPPSRGQYAGNGSYIEVVVQKPVERFFIGAVYDGPWEVSASAVAGLEPIKMDAALLALNSSSGGIQTSGSTDIRVVKGSVVSNYAINTSGSTRIVADKWVAANDGFSTSGSTTLDGGDGEMADAPEIPDPLAGKISPPVLPSFPGNPVSSVSPPNGSCREYSPWTNPVTYAGTPASYSNCTVRVNNVPNGQTFRFPSGQYRFQNNADIQIGGGNNGAIVLEGGTWNFVGNRAGIGVGGSTPTFIMDQGRYSFLDGASISIGGSAPDNVLGRYGSSANSSVFYFSGGGGIRTNGSNRLTLNPGTYIFDGGSGLNMSGSDQLILNSGTYEFWFRNGADLSFSGSSRIMSNGARVKMYFYGGSNNNWSDLTMSGSTSFNIPSGEYYFDRGRFLNSGSTTIAGQSVLLYFKNGGYLESTGSASFSFTAPTTQVYPGYYPGVFMYSDPSNTATFEWHGSTASVSRGAIYLPKSPLKFGGSSSGKSIEGQVIVDRLITSGSTGFTVEFVEYVATTLPKVYLVE